MKTKILFLILLVLLTVGGCGRATEDSNAIPTISTPAKRDAIILKELERQTELLRQINEKLTSQNQKQIGTLK